MSREILEWVKSIVVAVIIAVLVKKFIFYSVLVSGDSMEPTLHTEDRLFTSKISIYNKAFKYGDIVSFRAPNGNRNYIKRIIGLPGDIVEIKDGEVFLNNEKLDEDYIEDFSYTEIYNDDFWKVGEDQVFVLGDNRLPKASDDSRSFGPIDMDSIDGISNFRYYPIDKNFGRLNK